MPRYVTFHIQKDRRITLGTAVHKYSDCPFLLRTTARKVEIAGEIVQAIPKCHWCFVRQIKE